MQLKGQSSRTSLVTATRVVGGDHKRTNHSGGDGTPQGSPWEAWTGGSRVSRLGSQAAGDQLPAPSTPGLRLGYPFCYMFLVCNEGTSAHLGLPIALNDNLYKAPHKSSPDILQGSRTTLPKGWSPAASSLGCPPL